MNVVLPSTEKYERQMDHDNLDGVDFGLDYAG